MTLGSGAAGAGRQCAPAAPIGRLRAATHAERLGLILAALNAAMAPRDMGLPGLKLHPLEGGRTGSWSVSVSGNWRITFGFSGKDAVDIDYEDYH